MSNLRKSIFNTPSGALTPDELKQVENVTNEEQAGGKEAKPEKTLADGLNKARIEASEAVVASDQPKKIDFLAGGGMEAKIAAIKAKILANAQELNAPIDSSQAKQNSAS